MNGLLLQQRADQFDVKHGSNGLPIAGWLVFADGAMRQEQTGEMREPPSDPKELFPILAVYWNIVRSSRRRRFTDTSRRPTNGLRNFMLATAATAFR